LTDKTKRKKTLETKKRSMGRLHQRFVRKPAEGTRLLHPTTNTTITQKQAPDNHNARPKRKKPKRSRPDPTFNLERSTA
jgi:hypothetical protein